MSLRSNRRGERCFGGIGKIELIAHELFDSSIFGISIIFST